MKMQIPITEFKRKCGECTVCCEGYLDGEVRGHRFTKNINCNFLKDKKCEIYDERPNHPCREYNCFWKINNEIPDDMRPDLAKVLMTSRTHRNINYLQVLEIGKKIDSLILANIIQYSCAKNINVEYEVEGQFFYIGTKEFLLMVEQEKNRNRNEILNSNTNL